MARNEMLSYFIIILRTNFLAEDIKFIRNISPTIFKHKYMYFIIDHSG